MASKDVFVGQVKQALQRIDAEIQMFSKYDEDYAKLDAFLTDVHTTTRRKIKVPLGKLAFMEGELIHTNEVIVSLGANWFAERSTIESRDIVKRRREFTQAQLQAKRQERESLKLRLDVIGGGTGPELNEEGLEYVDIREEFNEDTEVRKDSSEKVVSDVGKPLQNNETAKLGKFEQDMMEKLRRYEKEELDARGEDSGSESGRSSESESHDSDEDEYENGLRQFSSGLREDDDDDDYNESDGDEDRTLPFSTEGPPAIRTPGDIYKRMKALSETGASSTVMRNVVEKEVESADESDFDDFVLGKAIATEYHQKSLKFFRETEDALTINATEPKSHNTKTVKFALPESDSEPEPRPAMEPTIPKPVETRKKAMAGVVSERVPELSNNTEPISSQITVPAGKISKFRASRMKE